MHSKTAQLLSDALTLDTQPQAAQERIMSGLLAEIEAANSKLSALTAGGGTPSPADTGDMLKMLSTFSQARQCCPQCQAAQAQLPPMNLSGCPAPPMLPPQMQPVMRSIVPFQSPTMTQMQPYFMGDHLADDLRKGAKDDSLIYGNVRSLQNALNRVGGSQSAGTNLIYGVETISVQVTGTFDDQTERAVKLFQKQRGLPQTGVADTATLSALGISLASSSSAGQSQAQTTKSGYSAETLRLQKLLKAAGYSVATDGVWGSKTEAALIKFQNANGLRGDGIVKDADWTKLQAVAGAKTGATSRAEAGKNDTPTTGEKLAPITKTLVRVVAPLTLGAATGVGLWMTVKQSNITQKAAICVGSGIAAAAVSYVAINFAADALTTIPEEQL